MLYGYSFQTVIGEFGVVESNGKIVEVLLPGETMPMDIVLGETKLLLEARRQLEEYLDGERKEFDLPIFYESTDFIEAVWSSLRNIAYGTTNSYKDIAISVGKPKAARAVGMANNRNPLPIIIPCHRVIGSKGKMVGYAGGLNLKKQLLELERIVCENEGK